MMNLLQQVLFLFFCVVSLAVVLPQPQSIAQSTGSHSGSTGVSGSGGSCNNAIDGNPPPDVFLNVPDLSVGLIQLIVRNLTADVNLNADVAKLVQINAGVKVGIEEVNLTIENVHVQLQLVVRLGNLVEIVNRVFSSLDLNPILINLISTVGSLGNNLINTLGGVLNGVVNGLLGTLNGVGGQLIHLLVDQAGNIIQQILPPGGGNPISTTVVGNYVTNMTQVGTPQALSNGNILKEFSFISNGLNQIVWIVFDAANHIISTCVVGVNCAV